MVNAYGKHLCWVLLDQTVRIVSRYQVLESWQRVYKQPFTLTYFTPCLEFS
jgi:hypothetical protein